MTAFRDARLRSTGYASCGLALWGAVAFVIAAGRGGQLDATDPGVLAVSALIAGSGFAALAGTVARDAQRGFVLLVASSVVLLLLGVLLLPLALTVIVSAALAGLAAGFRYREGR